MIGSSGIYDKVKSDQLGSFPKVSRTKNNILNPPPIGGMLLEMENKGSISYSQILAGEFVRAPPTLRKFNQYVEVRRHCSNNWG